MGKSMSATPTPESMVWQGGANTLENRCHTTPPLKGGRGWWGVHHLFGVGWGNDLVPMPPFLCRGGAAGRGCAFALCESKSHAFVVVQPVTEKHILFIFNANLKQLINHFRDRCSGYAVLLNKCFVTLYRRFWNATFLAIQSGLDTFERLLANVHTVQPSQTPLLGAEILVKTQRGRGENGKKSCEKRGSDHSTSPLGLEEDLA